MSTSALPAGLAVPIPLYVTPYYNSEGPEINVGPLSEALVVATPDTIGPMAGAWRPALALQPAVALFVLAVRLFDLGQHDAGLYWLGLGKQKSEKGGITFCYAAS